MKISIVLFILAACTLTSAQDNNDNNNFQAKNADDAEKLTKDFAKLTPNSPCKEGGNACVNDQFAQCVGGKFALNPCGGGGSNLKCVVLPLVNNPGTSITCSTEEDRLARLAVARGGAGKASVNNPKQAKGGKKIDNGVNNPGKGIGNNLDNLDQDNGDNDKNKDNGDQGKGNEGMNNQDQNNGKNGNGGGNDICKNNGKNGNGGMNGGNNSGKNKENNGNGGDNNSGKTNENNGNGGMNGGNDSGNNSGKTNENNGNSGNNDPQLPSNTGNNNIVKQDPKTPQKIAANDNIAEIRKGNAQKAEEEQNRFDSLTPDSSCTDNEVACVDDKLAQCSNAKFVLTSCGTGLKCASLPLVLKAGTSVTCTTEADRNARLDQARKNLK